MFATDTTQDRTSRRSTVGVRRKHSDLPRPEIVVRKPELRVDPERSKRWMAGGARTLLLHALSPTFPGGETFFIKTVMAYRDQIDDPQLLEEMRRFAAQEAVHTREHIAYDDAVQSHYDLKTIEDICKSDLKATYKWLSGLKTGWFDGQRFALAITVALEHVTATLGHQVLSNPSLFDGAEPELAKLWRWHAAEEIEHKAVAFDVFEAVGGKWWERCLALIIMSSLLGFDTTRLVGRFLAADGQRYSLQPWSEIFWFLWGSPGVLRRSIPQFFSFFRPSFHPWDHDDRPLLANWKTTYSEALVPA